VLRFLFVIALIGSLLLHASGVCLAQARPSLAAAPEAQREPAGYKAAIDSAVSEFEHSNYAEAREHFARAHTLFPNARTFRGLGMVEFELRNYVDAVAYLEQALASRVKALEGELVHETESLLQRAHAYVGTVELQLSPASTRVSIDGFPLADASSRRLRLPIGDHVLEFHAEGHLSERRAIKLRGEQELPLEVKLLTPPAPSGVAARAAGDQAATSDRAAPTPVYKRWWLWTSVGVVVAGGVVAAVLLSQKTRQEEEPVLTSNTPPNATLYPLRLR
jgi:hypothetical protein